MYVQPFNRSGQSNFLRPLVTLFEWAWQHSHVNTPIDLELIRQRLSTRTWDITLHYTTLDYVTLQETMYVAFNDSKSIVFHSFTIYCTFTSHHSDLYITLCLMRLNETEACYITVKMCTIIRSNAVILKFEIRG